MLIVLHEVDSILCARLAKDLRGEGHVIMIAGPERSAFELVYESRPDLAILDLEAPGRAAAETLRLISGNPRLKGTPLLLRSGPESGRGFHERLPCGILSASRRH